MLATGPVLLLLSRAVAFAEDGLGGGAQPRYLESAWDPASGRWS
jgi:hypothetical protein